MHASVDKGGLLLLPTCQGVRIVLCSPAAHLGGHAAAAATTDDLAASWAVLVQCGILLRGSCSAAGQACAQHGHTTGGLPLQLPRPFLPHNCWAWPESWRARRHMRRAVLLMVGGMLPSSTGQHSSRTLQLCWLCPRSLCSPARAMPVRAPPPASLVGVLSADLQASVAGPAAAPWSRAAFVSCADQSSTSSTTITTHTLVPALTKWGLAVPGAGRCSAAGRASGGKQLRRPAPPTAPVQPQR